MRRIHFALDCITGQVDYKAEEKGEGPKSDRRQNDGGCGCHLLPRLRAGPISTPLVDSLGLAVGRRSGFGWECFFLALRRCAPACPRMRYANPWGLWPRSMKICNPWGLWHRADVGRAWRRLAPTCGVSVAWVHVPARPCCGHSLLATSWSKAGGG